MRKITKTRKAQKKTNKISTIGRELKIIDSANSATASTAFVTIPLVQIQQGTSFVERVGYQVTVNSLDLRLKFDIGAAVIGSPNAIVRCIVYRDLQQIDSTTPAGLDVLSTADPVSQRNYYNQYRFQFVRDMTFQMNQYRPVVFKRLQLQLNTNVRFSGAGLASVTKNGYYLMIISSNSVNPPTVQWWNRVKFTDD